MEGRGGGDLHRPLCGTTLDSPVPIRLNNELKFISPFTKKVIKKRDRIFNQP